MTPELVLPASRFDVASFGELVSDTSRATMLLALMDGSARPATELANMAGVTPQTASFHLQRLVAGGLVRVEPIGRHRYFRLANDQVAEALEAVALLHGPLRTPTASQSPTRQALAHARTCYNHLAGQLGVAWLASLENARFLRVREGALSLSRRGIAWAEGVGLSTERWPGGKPCLDWTERRHHLGGPLGALLTAHLFALKWIARRGDGRAVRVTAVGQRELSQQLQLPESVL
ncbi:ArsR/SmtB family transcription factor [Pendulispora albinea]|uniref:Winged helix-turn-helix domain-containing protein n=1 Tax=Pendulispora albinea TaxID=2741071 RepID=A0ABZ2M3G2_9BACT